MKRMLLTLFCLLAPVAYGATQLEALRAGASAARAQMSSTRQGQLQGQGELNKLAGRIEELKAQAKGKLTPGSELDAALKRSQELSASLTSAASQLSTQEAALESANLALLGELSSELTRLRADFDRQTDRNARTGLIGKMRALRQEREQVRAMLPAAKLPALEAARPSDDPEDLLEQADLLKDNEDKVRKQLTQLERRIAEAKEERDLDNRVKQFLGDESIFDEGDRRLRVTRTETNDGLSAAPGERAGDNTPPVSAPSHTRFSAGQNADSAFTAEVQGQPGNLGGPVPGTTGTQGPTPASGVGGANSDPASKGTTGGGTNSPTTRTVRGADQRPSVGNRIAGNDEDDDLEDLEIQRAKLKGLAEELKTRAAQLQKKAAQLK